MKSLTHLVIFSCLAMAAAVSAQTPPPSDPRPPMPIERTTPPTERTPVPTDRQPIEQRTDQREMGTNDPDRMKTALQRREQERQRCQSMAESERQPCLDKAERDYDAETRRTDEDESA